MGTTLRIIEESLDLCIKEMIETDVDQVHEIEQKCFPFPWSRSAFLLALSSLDSIVLSNLSGEVIIGYLVGMPSLDEYSIYNIAISPHYQKCGMATFLLKNLIKYHDGVYFNYYLEVRRSNYRALSLYHFLGFRILYVRKLYYSNPLEDAFVMRYNVRGK